VLVTVSALPKNIVEVKKKMP